LDALWRAGWGSAVGDYAETVLQRSLAHLGAHDGDRLVGFVNVAWDGGIHAFILDTVVHPEFRRRGIASDLVRRATMIARERGAHWLHVDFEPQLGGFYRACGFRPTSAGLIGLR
jgi:ribosomal protein S18 acetylase RimI-like enzyme